MGGGPAARPFPERRSAPGASRGSHPTSSWAVLKPSLNPRVGSGSRFSLGQSRHLAGLWTPGQRAMALRAESIFPFSLCFTGCEDGTLPGD